MERQIRRFLTPKPKYPTTYKECCKVLGCKCIVGFVGLDDEEENLYGKFIALKRCRDAYWKIAGWELDWKNKSDNHNLIVYEGEIIKDFYCGVNHVLVFPTEEMRDAFYENFKDLIEQCKELV